MMTTLIDILPLVEDDTPEFVCASRCGAFDTLRRIAAATPAAHLDDHKAGHYTAFVPGWLHLVYDERSATAWLCDATVDGRLASVQAVARWER